MTSTQQHRGGSILGTEVRRVEDPELLVGRGSFVGNLDLDDTEVLHAAFVRSPVAHATIAGIDTSAAQEAEGVVAVFTAADLGSDPVPLFSQLVDELPRTALAVDRVRYVGDAVALVVASSVPAAVDAAELVDVDYEELDAVVSMEAALAEDAPLQFPDHGTNVVLSVRGPEEDVLDDAARVVRLRMENNRMASSPIEGHAILVRPEGSGESLTGLDVRMGTQHPHIARSLITKLTGLDKGAVRVRATHVGGAFGGKGGIIPDHSAVILAARSLGRPVRWVETRSESMLSMSSRGQVQYVELGLDEDARITGMRARVVGDCGAYAGFGGSFASGSTRTMSQGCYVIPRLRYDALSVMTNTAPTGAFRGAGRPEAAAMVERLVDHAARESGLSPEEFRRRNFVTDFPHETVFGPVYDSGDYAGTLDAALAAAGIEELRAEQARRREAGESWQLGIGISSYVEITGFGGKEYAGIRVAEDGHLTVMAGTSSHGQGHATAFSMIVADLLGVPLESISYVQSDTEVVRSGGGTGGARSLQLGGSAVRVAALQLEEKALEVAAELLEVAATDVELVEGRFSVRGVPGEETSVTWEQVAAKAHEDGDGLSVDADFKLEAATFPFGTHVSVVEVDVETGDVRLRRHVLVDDCGTIVNPLLVRGQQHGGAVQGISQALWEEFRYDEWGNPVTGTFADYPLPTAADLVQLEASNTQTPTDRNPLGAKGIGESATVGSTPAVQNAVIDAVAHLGVRHIDIPCTPERVMTAIWEAAAGEHEPWREPPAIFEDMPVVDEIDDVEV